MMKRLAMTLFLFCFAQTALWQVAAQTRNSVSKDDDGVWVWSWSEDGNSLELKVRGDVQFADDYTSVRRMSPGSSLRLKEKRGGVNRRLEIESGSAGMTVSYYVDGQSRPYDAEAKAWFSKVLTEAVVQTGLDAGPRAQRILKDSGVNGLLDEISRLRSDHVKHLYFQELFRSGRLEAGNTPEVLKRASLEIKSDHYLAQVMLALPEQLQANEAVRSAYLEAAGRIGSDHYRAQVISSGLKRSNPSKESLLMALTGAAGISSDHYKTQVLLKVAESSLDDQRVRLAYLEAAAAVQSDHYKTQALLKAAEGPLDGAAAGSAYLKAATSIGSDHYRSQALFAFLGKAKISNDALLATLKAAESMSDHYRAEMLLRLAATHSGDESFRAALVESARTIKSEHYRGRVLSAIFK